MAFIGIGGGQMLYSWLTLSQLFHERSSTVISVLNTAFDASVIVFTLFKVVSSSPLFTTFPFFFFFFVFNFSTVFSLLPRFINFSTAHIRANTSQTRVHVLWICVTCSVYCHFDVFLARWLEKIEEENHNFWRWNHQWNRSLLEEKTRLSLWENANKGVRLCSYLLGHQHAVAQLLHWNYPTTTETSFWQPKEYFLFFSFLSFLSFSLSNF